MKENKECSFHECVIELSNIVEYIILVLKNDVFASIDQVETLAEMSISLSKRLAKAKKNDE
jgi:hypothetical protein